VTSGVPAAKVEKALATLNRVVDHTARLSQAKNYPHLPHENDEFKEGGLLAVTAAVRRLHDVCGVDPVGAVLA
jgi:hypothetical protein